MKRLLYTLALCMALTMVGKAQDKKEIKGKGTITIYEDGAPKQYVFDVDTSLILQGMTMNEFLETMHLDNVVPKDSMENNQIRIEDKNDTVTIKVGRTTMRVIENENGSVVTFDDEKGTETTVKEFLKKEKKPKKKFDGHYGLMEFGVNTMTDPDYSLYAADQQNFLDLNHNRSTEFNLNLFWTSIGLQKNKGNIGIVTGLGFSWNNYFFAKDITIEQGDDMIVPIELSDATGYKNVEKTKLVASYLTIPLLFEFQVPTNNSPLYLQVGGIGGIKLNSHTKVKHGGNKDKDFDDFYLSPFRYGATARLGYGSIYLYANYFFSELFKDGRGPVTNPYTIGIGFPAF